MNTLTCVLCLIVIAAGFDAAQAVQCYVCQTGPSGQAGEATACDDPFDAAAAKAYLTDCSSLLDEPAKNYTMCRKFVQDVEGDYRVVRSCATAGRPGKCIDRTGTAKIKLQYCECENSNNGEACNFASQSVSTSGLVLGLTTVTVLLSASFFQ